MVLLVLHGAAQDGGVGSGGERCNVSQPDSKLGFDFRILLVKISDQIVGQQGGAVWAVSGYLFDGLDEAFD